MIFDRDGYPIQVGHFLTTVPTQIAMGTSSNSTGPLTANTVYRLWSSTDCFVLPGDVAVSTNTTGHPLTAKQDIFIYITGNNDTYLAAAVASATGTLYISEFDQGRR